jgi:hypothetical protein
MNTTANVESVPVQRRPAAESDRIAAQNQHFEIANINQQGIAQRKLAGNIDGSPYFSAQRMQAGSIDSSPFMVAQRKKLHGMGESATQLQGGVNAVQRIENDEEEPLQGKAETAQLEGLEEEEPLQVKFATAQLEGMEEEEPLQGRAETAQLEEMEEEEPLQGKFATAQFEGMEEEEPLQGKAETAQLEGLEEEEPLQGKAVGAETTIQRLESGARANNTGLPDNLKSGIENISGISMDDVKVHYDSAKPAQLKALAYAQGTNIHVAPGQEQHLPHEAWHVVQQKQGRVQPTRQMRGKVPVNDDKGLENEADIMGAQAVQMGTSNTEIPSGLPASTLFGINERSPRQEGIPACDDRAGVISRKLAGSTDAVTELGGEPTAKSMLSAKLSGLKAKFGKSATSEGSGKYAQIISGLRDYEKLEANYLSIRQNSLPAKDKAELLGRLLKLETLTESWLTQNVELKREEKGETNVYNAGGVENESELQKRYHALTMLLPRLRHEKMEIERDLFYQRESWSDQQLDKIRSTDDAFGGELNRLDKVAYNGSADLGVFLEDKPARSIGEMGEALGISTADPNQGARSVAMYQLSQLLNLGVSVIAKTEFATHTSATGKKDEPLATAKAKMGVRMEMAKGKTGAKTKIALNSTQTRAEGGDTVSLEDPILQRSLNALQLIDAIAGQLDRHWNNFYIATNGAGQVEGVLGIDLDMSFAPDHRTVAPKTGQSGDIMKGSHFVGLPKLVDSEFAQRIIAVEATQVAALLNQYLKPAEVSSTLERFKLVKDACIQILLRREAIVPGGWGARTAQSQLGESNSHTSYLSRMATAGIMQDKFSVPANKIVHESITPYTSDFKILDQATDKLEPFFMLSKVSAEEGLSVVNVIQLNYNHISNADATGKLARTTFATNLKDTPVTNWNTLLISPAADEEVLARCVNMPADTRARR